MLRIRRLRLEPQNAKYFAGSVKSHASPQIYSLCGGISSQKSERALSGEILQSG